MVGMGVGQQRGRLKCPSIDPLGEHVVGPSVSKLNNHRESVIWQSCT